MEAGGILVLKAEIVERLHALSDQAESMMAVPQGAEEGRMLGEWLIRVGVAADFSTFEAKVRFWSERLSWRLPA